MARASVVQPPRRAVVLRPGPPQRRGRAADLVALVLGVALLAASVLLVEVLPEEERIVPQHRITVEEHDGEEFGTQRAVVPAGQQHEFPYEVTHDNAFRITVSIEVQDDQPSSLPDRFELELVDPDGDTVGETRVFQTRAAQQKNQSQMLGSADAQPFFSELATAQFEFDVAPRPNDQIVDAAGEDETPEEAAQRLLPDLTVATQGTWHVRVWLVEAGGCPQPGGDPDTAFQAAVCNRDLQASGGQDPDNGIAITLVTYRHYTADVAPLAA